MMENSWTKSDRILFGIVYGTLAAGMAVWGIAQFIEACRSRPKVEMIVIGVPKGSNNGEKTKVEAVKESSAPSCAAE